MLVSQFGTYHIFIIHHVSKVVITKNISNLRTDIRRNKMPAEIIKNAYGKIMVALKEGQFTKPELEFLLKFFKRIVESTEKLLSRI